MKEKHPNQPSQGVSVEGYSEFLETQTVQFSAVISSTPEMFKLQCLILQNHRIS